MAVYKIFILLVFNRKCMERNVMTSFRILSLFECFLRYFQTEWSVFLILQRELFTSCNVSNNTSLVSARTEEEGGGGVNQSTKCGQAWTKRGGFQKFPILCGHPLWMTPMSKSFNESGNTTISFIILWDFSMFYEIFLSPQVKQCAIITYTYGVYELPHELPDDLRLRKYQETP